MPPRLRRRLLRALAAALASLLALGLMAALLIPRAVEHALRDGALTLAHVTGRTVTLGTVDVHFGSTLRAEVRDLDVAAQDGAPRRAALLHAGSVRVEVRWHALLRGRALDVSSIDADDVAIDLVRAPDGTLSLTDVLARLRAAPPLPDALRRDGSVRVDRLALHDARVTFVALDPDGSASSATLSHLEVTARDLARDTDPRFTLDGTLLADAYGLHASAALQARARYVSGRVDIDSLGVVLGPLHVLAHGAVDGLDSIDLSFDSGDVALEGMTPFVPPEERARWRTSALRGAVRVSGELKRSPGAGDHARLSLTLRDASVHTGTTDFDGSLDLLADATSRDPRTTVPWIETVALNARVAARELRARGVTLTRVDARVAIAHGFLDASSLRFGFAGGAVDLLGTRVHLVGEREVTLRADAKNIDLALAGLDPAHRPTGRVSFDANVRGFASGDHPERGFTGTLRATGTNLRVEHMQMPTISVSNPLLPGVSLGAPPAHARDQTPLNVRRVDARFRVARGALRAEEPLTADTNMGSFAVTGTVEMTGALDLRGTMRVSPETIAARSNGRLRPLESVPLHVHVTGEPTALRVEVTDLDLTLRALTGAWPGPHLPNLLGLP